MRKHSHRNQAQIGAQRFGLPQPLRGFALMRLRLGRLRMQAERFCDDPFYVPAA